MQGSMVFALCGAVLVGIGAYGFVTRLRPLHRIVAFNVVGGGLFLYFGALTRTSAGVDPVAQALVITGIVVALSLTALAVALVLRLADEGEEDKSGAERPGPGTGGGRDGLDDDDGRDGGTDACAADGTRRR